MDNRKMDELQQLETQARQCVSQKDYLGIRHSLEQAHNIAQNANPADLLHIAQLLNNTGFIYRETGDFQTARIYFERAFKIYRESGSRDNPDLAITFPHLGQKAQIRRDNRTAWVYWTEELDFRRI